MQQNDSERAIQEQQHLPREFTGVADPLLFEGDAQPGLELLLVRRPDPDRRVARQIGKLGGGAQEAAAAPFRMPRRARQVAEDRCDLVRQSTFSLVEPPFEQRQIGLVARGEIGRNQIVLALEVIVQRPLGQPGLLGHRIDAHGPDALAVEQRAGGGDNALTGRIGRSSHDADVYRPVNIHNGAVRLSLRQLAALSETMTCPEPFCSISATASRCSR